MLHRVEMAHVTNIGVVTMEKAIALSTVAYFGNIGYSEKIVGSVLQLCLFVLTIKYVMVNLATDWILLTSKGIMKKKLALIADKGENKGGTALLAKIMAWYNEIREWVEVICFGIETLGNSSSTAASGIKHALKLFE